nr:hypothetical protein [uncultured Cohaesibacter sp.]
MTLLSSFATFFKILQALLNLAAAGAEYAKTREVSLAARQKVLLSLFQAMTERVNAAKKAGLDFDAELRSDPDSLFRDDGFKRHSNQIRAPTDIKHTD